ncbi:MAG: hypothetical protein WBX15_17930 [Thermoanaerobaculia bacterium]
MPRTDFQQVSDSARVWVFGADTRLEGETASGLLEAMDRFLEEWNAHGAPVTGARELLHGCFLLVAAEEADLPSGCSIDSLYRTLAEAGQRLGVSMLRPLVFYRTREGEIRGVTRDEFRREVEQGRVDLETEVFDTTIESMKQLRSDGLGRPAAESWHATAFPFPQNAKR